MKLLITGLPGTGKTTLCRRVIDALKGRLKVGGIITEEVRRSGLRTGFKIRDVYSGREKMLASVNYTQGPRVGKYRVDLETLEDVGVKAVEKAVEECDLIVIDEIGKMELKSERFAEVVAKAFNSEKHVIATIPLKFGHKIIKEVKSREDVTTVEINPSNRDLTLEKILGGFER